MTINWSKMVAKLGLLSALAACGGGGWNNDDPITGITATNFKYGQLATLTLTGNALDNVIKLSSDKCLSVTLSAIESSSRRQATCIVAATGPIEFTVKSNADYTVYSTSLTAPEPIISMSAANFKFRELATLTLSGNILEDEIKLTSDKCSNITLGTATSDSTRSATCIVNATGPIQFKIKSGLDYLLHTTTINAPTPITSIAATNFKLGQLATLILTGNSLDSSIKLTSDKCINITLGPIESAFTRQASCLVTTTGQTLFTVSNNSNDVLYSTNISSEDTVTGITATNFKYGQLATLTLTGNALDNVIKLSSDKCLSVTLGAIESSSRRQATCIVAATGPIEFTVKSNADYTVYSTSLTVPEPVTGISASNLKYGQTAVLTLSGDPQNGSIKVSSDKCTGMTLDATSSAATRTARCTVTGTGAMKLTVTNTSGGTTLYTQTVSVPEPQVSLVTSLGTVVMELNPTAAPITVKNFLAYVNQNPSFYNGTLFHRVIPGFMAQGGGFTTGMNQKSGLSPAIALESQNGLLNVRGSLAMARTSVANSATSQFFVNLVDNAFLNYASANSPGYAVFGKVISGMDVIDLMANQDTRTVGINQNVPVTDITITSATQTQ